MAQKVYSRRVKGEKIHQIDHIPDHRKQRRSPASKRKRTDFSIFSSASEYFRDSVSTQSATESDDNKGEGNKCSELFTLPTEERSRPLSDIYGVPVAEGESFGKKGINCSNSQQESEVAVSEFENCFESCNLTEDLQDAVKQVPKRKEDLGSPANLPRIPDGSNHSDQQVQSRNKYASSISSTTEADFKPWRVSRDRRPNIRFDEVTFQQNPARNVRRFRIMRHLGLIAPVGSPF